MRKIILLLMFILAACSPVSAPMLLGTPSAILNVPSQYQTIQSALNAVRAGQEVLIQGGTYNESLTLKTTGTQLQPISIRCASPLGCTVNSGVSRTLVTSGAISFYSIDGFRFISTYPSTNDPMTSSVNFGYDFWGDGHTKERGNDGFVLRNCYVEGAVYFYGSDNLVENCEMNGRGVVVNGLIERSQPSENNIFRNNIIHDYYDRGGWTLSQVENSLWENNIFYNISLTKSGGAAIDCDGAGEAVYQCNIKDNLFYNNGATQTIEMENGFDSIIENNVIRDGKTGVHVINYNKENGDGFNSSQDYKGLVTNTIIRNNVIYNMSVEGILCHAVRGNQAINNTIYNAKVTRGYFGAVGLTAYGGFGCPDWTIKNNIVSQSPKTVWVQQSSPVVIDNNFYDDFGANIENSSWKTFSQWQALGYDANSKTGNPSFVNATAGDFHLQPNSLACGYGAFPCGIVTMTSTPTRMATNTVAATTAVPSTSAPTRTPTVTPTRTQAPTATYTYTPTYTPTPTPTMTSTATDDMCVKVTWGYGLNLRETASMSNLGRLGFLYKGTTLLPLAVETNHEGLFAQYGKPGWILMQSVPSERYPNGRTYAIYEECK